MQRQKILSVLFLLCLPTLVSCSGTCPSGEGVKAAVKKIMPVNFEVAGIRKMGEVPGICEVAITVNKQPVVFYIDSKGKYILSGSILEVRTGKNITLEGLQKYKQ